MPSADRKNQAQPSITAGVARLVSLAAIGLSLGQERLSPSLFGADLLSEPLPRVAPARSPAEVTILPQVHNTKGLTTARPEFESVAQSQYMIAMSLSRLTNALVIYEGASSLMTLESVLKSARRESVFEVQRTFPRGLPLRYADLTARQKEVLVEASGGPTALYCGNIKAIIPAIPPNVAKLSEAAASVIEQAMSARKQDPFLESPAYRFFICDMREREFAEALGKAVSVQERTGGTIVGCIGVAHLMTFGAEVTNRFTLRVPEAYRAEVEKTRSDPYYRRVTELLARDRQRSYKDRFEAAQREVFGLIEAAPKKP